MTEFTACKKMCKQCPWRKESIAGWLGEASPEEFVDCISKESIMPCHSLVDYDDPDWLEKVNAGEIKLCAGALQATRRLCKLPRNKEHAYLVKNQEIEENHMSVNEFIEHHNSSAVRSWND